MAVPVRADRCPSCRARVRSQELVVDGPTRTGPDAAEAWARVRRDELWSEPDDENDVPPAAIGGDVHDTRPVGPGAVAAHLALRLVMWTGVVALGVALTRAVLALAVDDADDASELTDLGWWTALSDLAVVAVVLTGGAVVASAVFLVRWASAAGHNVQALALDPRRWLRSSERVAARTVLAVALVVAWGIAPSGPERADRAIDLALGGAVAIAVVLLAAAVQRLLVSVTTTELQRAELLTRIESAAALRPRHR